MRISPTAQKGFGVFAEEVIPQGTIVLEYVGEVLRRAVAEDRIRSHCDSRNYMLEVRENYANMVLHREWEWRKKHKTSWLIPNDDYLRREANCDPFFDCCNRPTDYKSSLFLS